MKITNEIFVEYLQKTKPKYNDEVIVKLLSSKCDIKLAEKSAIKFYSKKNGGIKPIIKWVENPLVLRDYYPGKKLNLISSYLNINWIYFYMTFIDNINENNLSIKKEYHDITNKKHLYDETKLVFDILLNCFGVCEISGLDEQTNEMIQYKEIILIKKPKNISIVDNKLHSIKSPAFYYDDIKFYYLEGIKFEENMWIRIIKTGLNNPNSIINAELKGDDKIKLKKFISTLEKKNGKQNELTIKDILSIKNVEEKSKVIRYVGIDKVMGLAELISEESITTNKGDILNYQLFDIQLGLEPDGIPSRFVKVICWSTGKEYMLQVDPRNKQCETPLGAIAWTCVKPDGNHCTEDEYIQINFES